jgi:hypothetical protein
MIQKCAGVVLLCILFVSLNKAQAAEPTDRDDIKTCLSKWPQNPFKGEELHFRTLSTSVKVLGVGGAVKDSGRSEKPELVLIKPSVAVLSKAEMYLENPNGWYCLSSNVTVLSKSVIHLACKANLASARDGVAVLGKDEDQSGVTVLGKTQVIRDSCRK